MNRILIKYFVSISSIRFEINIFPFEDKYKALIRTHKEEKELFVTKENFNKIYNRLLEVDFNKIMLSSDYVAMCDGDTLIIKFGDSENNIVLTIGCIDYDTENRSLKELYDIIISIIKLLKIDSKDFYFLN